MSNISVNLPYVGCEGLPTWTLSARPVPVYESDDDVACDPSPFELTLTTNEGEWHQSLFHLDDNSISVTAEYLVEQRVHSLRAALLANGPVKLNG